MNRETRSYILSKGPRRIAAGRAMPSAGLLAAVLVLAFWAGAPAAGAQGATQGASAQGAPSATEILDRVDANLSFKSIRYAGRMEIVVGGQTRVKSMEAVAQGSEKAFIEFTNPEDRGVRYLKLGKDLWMYFPKEGDTVKISGHLLKEGMMGSDVSYEDALESSDLEARYTATYKGEETVEGRRAHVLELAARLPSAPYARRILWIDAERYVSLKEEMYAASGRLLKVSRTLRVERLGGRWFAAAVEMESKLRKNTKTVFTMDRLELDPALDARQFTMSALTK